MGKFLPLYSAAKPTPSVSHIYQFIKTLTSSKHLHILNCHKCSPSNTLTMNKMEVILLLSAFLLATCPFALSSDLEKAKREFTKLIMRNDVVSDNRPYDILFLLDTSGSLWHREFDVEKQFVTNFLNMLSVNKDDTRVEVIPFGTTASRYIDQVSNPASAKNKCTLKEKLKRMPLSINGWLTNMKDAFQLAYQVCLGVHSAHKRPISMVKTVVILLTDGYWNYPWADPNPIPIAKKLQEANVEVFVIGISLMADKNNLPKLISEDKDRVNHVFFLETFAQLEKLSMHVKGEKPPTYQPVTIDKCPNKCDPTARCVCGLVDGDYGCLCPEGHVGSGTVGQCRRLQGKKRK